MRGREITFRNTLNWIHNSGYGFRSSKPKIFLIGFNKIGTTSFHRFFHAQGLRSIHWKLNGQSLAVEVSKARDIKNCQKFFANGQVFQILRI